eukprot:scaffold43060_cov56-Phaeocystis_antarctica.AAC.2
MSAWVLGVNKSTTVSVDLSGSARDIRLYRRRNAMFPLSEALGGGILSAGSASPWAQLYLIIYLGITPHSSYQVGLYSSLWNCVSLRHLCGKQGGSDLGQLALRRPLSAPDRASGYPELRPASANQPLGPRWPAI